MNNYLIIKGYNITYDSYILEIIYPYKSEFIMFNKALEFLKKFAWHDIQNSYIEYPKQLKELSSDVQFFIKQIDI